MQPKPSARIKALLQQGQEQHEDAAYEAELATYTEILALDPACAEVYRCRGISYYCLARHEEARSDLEAARRLDPSDAETHFWLGMSLLEQGVERQRDATPAPTWISVMGGTYHHPPTIAAAIASMSIAIRLNPNYFYIYQRGVGYELSGQFVAARSDYETILQMENLDWPSYREAALCGRARTQLALGNEEAGQADLVQYNRIQDQNQRPYAKLNINDLLGQYRLFRTATS